MKYRAIFIAISLSFMFAIGSYSQQDDFPVLKGPYLGQTEPGMKPEIFAPGIVSTEQFREFSGTFTPDGKEYYFFRFADSAGMMVCKFLDEGWKRGNHSSIAPDESFLIYDSQKSGSEWDADENLFICFRNKNGFWGESIDLGSILNLPGGKMLATISPDGNYLFFCNRGDIYWVSLRIVEELKPKELKSK